MKVLFICFSLTGGGAERVCADVASGLAQRGHEVAIAADLAQPITYKPDDRVKLINLPYGPLEHSLWRKVVRRVRIEFEIWPFLWRLIHQEKPDVIISILFHRAIQVKIISLLSKRCPVILSDHDPYDRPEILRMTRREKFNKFFLPYFFDHLTVLTKIDRECLQGRFKNVSVMPNPVKFIPVNRVPQKEKSIIAVGRVNFYRIKGFDILIKAWKRIEYKYPDWHLRIIGAGNVENVSKLEELAAESKQVHFIPHTSDIIKEYNRAELFVLSSRYEGFPLVLLEAMSQGCACIGCSFKGRLEEIIVDGVNGVLCETENVEMLADKMDFIISNKEARFNFQENAIHSLDRFRQSNISAMWEDLIKRVIAKC